MKSFVLLVAATVVGVFSVALPAASGSGTGTAGQIPVKTTPDSQAKAKKLYEMDCALCHGDNGNGQTDVAKEMSLTLPDWNDGKTLAAMSDKDLFDLIRKGKDKMPPEVEARAKDDDVWNLVVYIRRLSKAGPAPANTASTAQHPQ